MRSTVIAVVLCLSAATAAAQCVAKAPVAGVDRARLELIKTAAADSRTPALPQDDGLPAIQETRSAASSPGPHSHRSGPAMLLAALALMSGIALRRFSARMQ